MSVMMTLTLSFRYTDPISTLMAILFAFEGGINLLAIQGNHISSHNLAGNDMVEQDVGQLLLVFGQEQAVEGASRQGSEGIIGGGKDGEGSFVLRASQPARLPGGLPPGW